MNLLLWAWLVLTIAALLVWMGRLVLLGLFRRILPPLHSGMYADASGALPAMSMLVAGKDEEANIEACLESLCCQDYPGLEIIAINDRSSDATAEMMDSAAWREPALRAHHVRSLPDGWFGKNNAMREGVSLSSGEWLCFTDADCVLESPRSLTVAMRYALETGADFISVLPSHEVHSIWERVIQPACSGVLLMWFNPVVVNNPNRKTAYANGAFMLLRRSCYDAIGGHEVIKEKLNEDIHLAINAKASGHRLRVVGNRDLYSVRMYGTLRDIWAGWSRIFFGCFGSLRRLLLAAGVVLASSLLPWLTLLVSCAFGPLGQAGSVPGDWLCWVSAATCAVQLVSMMLFYGLSRVNPLYGLAYPIGAVFGFGMLLKAAQCAAGDGTVVWRGTPCKEDGAAS
jgi:cellulose synthase/poly-beta-1,6-N-acetylglucosamine synthase-like glycosyltransferase